MTKEFDKINKQLKDLRVDYDELTDWVSQIHHKLDNHIREYTRYIEEQRKETLTVRIKNFFNKHCNLISVLLGLGLLLACVILSSLRVCGII